MAKIWNIKGEANVLLSFVASQTMIYIVFAVTLLICQKALPFPLKIKNKFKNLNFSHISKNLNPQKRNI
ncbi:hypothetical protein, partial [Campylobacter lanienae]|uniref:hypothetical protein n=1 Tax=Campylobacter lanienae TaxID=75658 RepID=UPI001F228A7A